MNESTWRECIESNSSLRISPDKSKAKSLLDTARERNVFLNEISIKEGNANYIFEGYYSSALEMMHALLFFRGYKVNNHICLGFYMRDILKREDLFRLFDNCRFKRNSLIYYGRKMDFETAKSAIKECERLIKELENTLKKELK